MLTVGSVCGACCSVSSHCDCMVSQTDCGLDHCFATRPRGPFHGQQTRAASLGCLPLHPSVRKLSVHTVWVKPQSMSDQSEDTILFCVHPIFYPVVQPERKRIRTCCLESGRTSEFNKAVQWRWVTLCVLP